MKKRDSKKQVKEVKFAEKVQTHFLGERSWNGYKKGRTFTRGAFTADEVDKLKQALCSYASEKPNPIEIINLLCSKSKSELPPELYGAWPKIAECLPERTVQACHNLCRRRFNPDNYSGKWTPDEEAQLKQLVRDNQTAWKEITALFNEANPHSRRTSGNIKDKWKQMGADNAAKRRVGPWSLQEALELLDLVCTATNAKIMKSSVKVVFKEEQNAKKFEVRDGEVLVYR